MQLTFVVRHLEHEDVAKSFFEERAARLKKHLARFRDELIYLHGALEKNPHKEEYYASLSLYIPTAVMHCRERGQDWRAALNEALLDLARQIEKHKAKLTREKRRRIR